MKNPRAISVGAACAATTAAAAASAGVRAAAAFALVFLIAAAAAGAQETVQRLTVASAVEFALENNLGLKSSRIDGAVKKRKVDTAWNVFIPTVDLGATLNRLNEAPQGTSIRLSPTMAITTPAAPQWGLSASLSASLNLNVALLEGMRNLRLDYEAGLIGYEKAKAQIERDVRKNYHNILLLGENIGLMEQNLAAAERRVALAQSNYRSGLAPELTVLQAQVAVENLKPALAELNNAYETSLAAFGMTLGLPRTTRLELGSVELPNPADLDLEDLILKATANKPELLELRQSLINLASARKLAFLQAYTPTLSLGWNLDPSFQKDPWEASWFNGDDWKQRAGMFRMTLAFRLNGLLPFSKEALGLTDLDDNREKLGVALAQAVRATELEIYSAYLKLEKSRKSMEALAFNINLAERAYKLTEQAYQAGLKDLLEVQNGELELRKAQLEAVKERFNYMNSILDLEYATAVPFGTLVEGR